MAGPMLNLTIFRKSTFHALRAISLATFPLGFLFLFIQGVACHTANPAIGILPLFFSSAFSALLLANERKCGCQASGLTGTPIHLVADLILGAWLLVCLILDWVLMGRGRCNKKTELMLGTYGTNFLICNFLIHLYFVGMQLRDAMLLGMTYPASCPQCQNRSLSFGSIKLGTGQENGYTPLLDAEGGLRSSIEVDGMAKDGSIV
ncbi:hypothetical protein P153DRAFT_303286 [Dothidotthia symphoricarpi CBS 119687]|uniref:MARVEL domain-containing protein n=1 Tax=Dothidotthia symphoricarpi CBS 119687 TaxID=1392245 RepID=A0A6A5ZW99_9PLEO|nr:uncharacterized protein P153DRAFT_303286 [Dothidotthia symphoricarpi CBS 119687]KAF2124022.1 hypothetical protein P153DRAFT_303286 [Dothidotthia symphoricarpi CBS 119687]